MSRDFEEKPQVTATESSKEKELTSTQETTSSKKDRSRGLLHVPSRSSSQKIQPSPTSTGLSGATASDPRDSIGGQSKESKGSMLGRHRNGSASSNQSGMGTGPTNTPGNSQPSSPAVAAHNKKKKSGGIMALFNCCGVPDHANGLDTSQDQVHRVEKLAPRPTTASRRTLTPSDQPSSSKTQLPEKETQPQHNTQSAPGNSTTEKRESGTSTQDQSTVSQGDAESKQTTLVGNSTTAPAVTVDPPNATSSETTEPAAVAVIVAEEPKPDERDAEGDVPMPDADPPATKQVDKQSVLTQANEQQYTAPLPPPPPGPVPAVPNPPNSHLNEQMPAFVPDQPTKYLLPPQAPEFKGKKCLVLDLDETLVHSSFKVCRVQSWLRVREAID
jgi:RNA polymerase II subunit A small phosphatase-like protein